MAHRFKFAKAAKAINIEGASFLQNGEVFAEEKFDGSRFGLELTENGWVALSRNGIDRADNIPYIIEALPDVPVGTVFDGEIVHIHEPREKRWELARSVMGTKGYNPSAKPAHYVIFDIQWYGDMDMQLLPYLKRKARIYDILSGFSEGDTVHYTDSGLAVPKHTADIESMWNYVVEEQGGEGIMLKDNRVAKYGKDWIKVKKEDTVDAFILGATPGKGKYEGMIGALELAVMSNDMIFPIGKCSGMTDAERREMTNLALEHKLKNRVCEVKYNEVTKNKQLRHPRFIRWREDKTPEQCLLEQLL